MQRLASQINEMVVFDVHSGTILGHVQALLVNPDTLKVVVLKITMHASPEPHYLLPIDVRHSDATKLIVDSHTALSEAGDLIRLRPFIDQPFLLVGAQVITQSGKKLGKVRDFTVTIDDFLVTKLYLTARSIWRVFYESHIIDRGSIVDVKDNKTVVVKDSTIRLQKSSATVLPAKG